MAKAEIAFNGETINESFDFEQRLCLSLEGIGDTLTRLAIKPRTVEEWSYEFYHNSFLIERGGDEALSLPGISFRVDSLAFDFCWSRDRVERNNAIDLVLGEIQQAVERLYIPYLIECAVNSPEDDIWAAISHYLPGMSQESVRVPVLPASDGSKLSLLELARQVRRNKLRWTSTARKGPIVLWDGASRGLRRLLTKISGIRGSFVRGVANRLYPARDVELVKIT